MKQGGQKNLKSTFHPGKCILHLLFALAPIRNPVGISGNKTSCLLILPPQVVPLEKLIKILPDNGKLRWAAGSGNLADFDVVCGMDLLGGELHLPNFVLRPPTEFFDTTANHLSFCRILNNKLIYSSLEILDFFKNLLRNDYIISMQSFSIWIENCIQTCECPSVGGHFRYQLLM